jgi:hypothetical protein
MTILHVILIFNILLALDRLIRILVSVNWEKFRYYLRFWIPLRKWVWSKIPIIPNEKWEEFQSKAWDKITDTPEKKEILDYELPWFYNESTWDAYQIEMKRKRVELLNQIKQEERKLFIQHIIQIRPWTKILFQIKFLQ